MRTSLGKIFLGLFAIILMTEPSHSYSRLYFFDGYVNKIITGSGQKCFVTMKDAERIGAVEWDCETLGGKQMLSLMKVSKEFNKKITLTYYYDDQDKNSVRVLNSVHLHSF